MVFFMLKRGYCWKEENAVGIIGEYKNRHDGSGGSYMKTENVIFVIRGRWRVLLLTRGC